LGANHFARLLESYHLATKQPAPPGFVLVHGAPQAHKGAARRFRAWWARPGEEYLVCACGWRPDFGEHYRIYRPGPVVRRALGTG
jgi:hypothetical protein